MKNWKLTTKWFTFEFGTTTKLLFFSGCLLITVGGGILSKNLLVFLAGRALESNTQNCQCYDELIGSIILGVGILFIVFTVINWRVDIYYNIFLKTRKTVDALFTFTNFADLGTDIVKLQAMKDANYEEYLDAIKYLSQNKILINEEIFKETWAVLHKCAHYILGNDDFIKQLAKIVDGKGNGTFSPSGYIKEIQIEQNVLGKKYAALEGALRKKMRWKIVH